jgi:hypothetical protein
VSNFIVRPHGLAGVKSGEPSASCLTLQMCSVPLEGETIHIARSLMPDICFTGPYAPAVEAEGQYAGYVALQVAMVSHRIDEHGHRPYLFCKRVRPPVQWHVIGDIHG